MDTQLPKVTKRRSKRVGRGYGSGKGGHTASRGTKGQKARGSVHILFEGLKMKKSFIKRLPFRRGKGKFTSRNNPIAISLSALADLPVGTKVTLDTLIKHNIVSSKNAKKYGVKVLADMKDFKKKLTVEVPTSTSAASLIEKAGGSVLSSPETQEKDTPKEKKETKKK